MYRAVVLVTLVGCYSPSYSNCTISCSESCPNGLTCDTQLHVCRTPGRSCNEGAGDASIGSDADLDMDAMLDGPTDGAAGDCTLVQEIPAGQDGGNLTVDLSTRPIAQGDFVVVTIAGRGPSSINTVSDLNSHQFSQAIKSQVTAGGTSTTAAIYYMLAAPVAMSVLNVNWTGNVTQTIIVGDWHCGAAPSALSRTGMTNGASAGTSTDTGAFTPPARALVVASLAQTTSFGTQVQTTGFTLLDQISQSGTSGAVTNTAVRGIVDAGINVDVTFSTASGGSFAGTAAAFTVQ